MGPQPLPSRCHVLKRVGSSTTRKKPTLSGQHHPLTPFSPQASHSLVGQTHVFLQKVGLARETIGWSLVNVAQYLQNITS